MGRIVGERLKPLSQVGHFSVRARQLTSQAKGKKQCCDRTFEGAEA
jgi:hypothetical protein